MRVGVCSFTVRHLRLSPFEMLDLALARQLGGVQFGTLGTLSASLDVHELRAIKEYADERSLYTHVSLSLLNPYRIRGDKDAYATALRRDIELCAAVGWREVRAALGSGEDRFGSVVPWIDQLRDCIAFIRRLAPTLRDHGVRISIENHADVTSFELVRMVEALGSDILGVCLDTANLFCTAEPPLAATRRVAPYVRLVHAKDAILYLSSAGFERQVRPVGQGSVPWAELLRLLGSHHPELALSIEDHQENPGDPHGKRSYGVPVFDPHYSTQLPDLSAQELAELMRIAYRTRMLMERGEIPPPEAFAQPWEARGIERLDHSASYLDDVVERLNHAA